MTYKDILEIFSFIRMVGRYEVYRMSLQARMRRCSSLQGAALRASSRFASHLDHHTLHPVQLRFLGS
ncbi:hypothetical protein [Nitrosomonas sp. Is37]|uniref:hypothetical protein n=1 Tax=Nitrosomonas sp. Is37 TaxID=3080535 RepID=UPI00294ACF3E|nr:hypothetical protein [Nitrosomonas sp. Is37]